MAKFTLSPAPTFKARVNIPVPGDKPASVEFTFKHRTRDQFKDFIEKIGDREDVDVIMDVASGWNLDEAFDDTAIDALTQNYIGSARAIIETYINALTSARTGN